MQISFKKIMLIYKINFYLLPFFPYLFIFFVGVAYRGVPDADRQKYKQTFTLPLPLPLQTDFLCLLRQRISKQTDDLSRLRQRLGEQTDRQTVSVSYAKELANRQTNRQTIKLTMVVSTVCVREVCE